MLIGNIVTIGSNMSAVSILEAIEQIAEEGRVPTVREVCSRAHKSARDVGPTLAAWRKRTQTNVDPSVQLENNWLRTTNQVLSANLLAAQTQIVQLEQRLQKAAEDLATAKADAEAALDADRRWMMMQTDEVRQQAVADVKYWKGEAERLLAALNARKAELRADSWKLIDPNGLLASENQLSP